MANHLYFRTSSGQWEIMVLKNFTLLLEGIKKKKITAVTADEITKGESEIIKKEGFSLYPEHLEIKKKPYSQIFNILEIR